MDCRQRITQHKNFKEIFSSSPSIRHSDITFQLIQNFFKDGRFYCLTIEFAENFRKDTAPSINYNTDEYQCEKYVGFYGLYHCAHARAFLQQITNQQPTMLPTSIEFLGKYPELSALIGSLTLSSIYTPIRSTISLYKQAIFHKLEFSQKIRAIALGTRSSFIATTILSLWFNSSIFPSFFVKIDRNQDSSSIPQLSSSLPLPKQSELASFENIILNVATFSLLAKVIVKMRAKYFVVPVLFTQYFSSVYFDRKHE